MNTEINTFYQLLKRNPREKNKFYKRLREVKNEEDLINFIDMELIPLTKKKGFYFTIKDFLKYGEQSTRELSEEDLLDVSGGISFISKKMLPLFLAGISFSSNIPITHAAVTECVSSVGKGQDTTQGLEENQVEGYDIKKVFNRCGEIYTLYEHKKTGAKVIVKEGDDRQQLITSFKAPSENDKGTIHVLEHCLISKLLYRNDIKVNGLTTDVMFNVNATDTGKSVIFNDTIKDLLMQLKDPDFLKNRSIFDKESYYIYKSPYTGRKFLRGRVFSELTVKGDDDNDRILHSFMNHDNKTQFMYGGIPSEVKKLSYEEVCEAYQKYVHPSNSLSIIHGKNYKDVMKVLDEQYFSKYEKKDIKVDYNLKAINQENNYLVFEVNKADEFRCCFDTNAMLSEDSNYKAIIGYSLGKFSDSECDPFRVKCGAINDKKSTGYKKGYKGISARVADDKFQKYVYLEIYGDNADLFEKNKLLANVKEIINESSNSHACEYEDDLPHLYRLKKFTELLQHSFALYGDPFSENVFTIKDGEIKAATVESITAEESEKVLKKMETPQEIMVLKKGENAKPKEYAHINLKVNGKISDDSIKEQVALHVINKFILDVKLKKEGVLYYSFAKRGNYFQTSERRALEDLKEFFDYDFPKLVSNFELTSDMLDEVKNTMLMYLYDDSEKEKIKNAKAEEIQELIRNIPPIVLEEET